LLENIVANAILEAERVIFLGLAFDPRNVERLQLRRYMLNHTIVFATTYGLSPNRAATFVHTCFDHVQAKQFSAELEDAYEFLRLYPRALD
jgi:hypothetical protein